MIRIFALIVLPFAPAYAGSSVVGDEPYVFPDCGAHVSLPSDAAPWETNRIPDNRDDQCAQNRHATDPASTEKSSENKSLTDGPLIQK